MVKITVGKGKPAVTAAAPKATAQATVDVVNKKGKEVIAESNQEETVELPSTLEPAVDRSKWCEVGLELSNTINLGNFESARISVSLKVPCDHEEINETFDFAVGWIDKRINDLRSELQPDE